MFKTLYLRAKQIYPMLRCKNLHYATFRSLFLVFTLLFIGSQDAKATHALGGDLTYICV